MSTAILSVLKESIWTQYQVNANFTQAVSAQLVPSLINILANAFVYHRFAHQDTTTKILPVLANVCHILAVKANTLILQFANAFMHIKHAQITKFSIQIMVLARKSATYQSNFSTVRLAIANASPKNQKTTNFRSILKLAHMNVTLSYVSTLSFIGIFFNASVFAFNRIVIQTLSGTLIHVGATVL